MTVCCFARVDPNQILLFQCTIQEAQIIWRELHIILRITNTFHESFSAKCVSHLVRQHLCVLCCYQKNSFIHVRSDQHLFNLYISVRPHNYEASNAFVKGVIELYCNIQRVFGAHVHPHKRQNFAVAFLNYGKPKRQP